MVRETLHFNTFTQKQTRISPNAIGPITSQLPPCRRFWSWRRNNVCRNPSHSSSIAIHDCKRHRAIVMTLLSSFTAQILREAEFMIHLLDCWLCLAPFQIIEFTLHSKLSRRQRSQFLPSSWCKNVKIHGQAAFSKTYCSHEEQPFK
jgi:hypothetical protein